MAWENLTPGRIGLLGEMSWENWAPRRNVLGEFGSGEQDSWEKCPRRIALLGEMF